jgi:putative DNA primase/helicase
MEIPKQLQNEEFRFIRLNGKIPIDKEWQKLNNFKFNDTKILEHNQNVGVVCGKHNLVVIDIDGNYESTLAKINEILPKTYTVKTGKQGMHLFYITDELVSTTALSFNESHIDIKANGGQVVMQGSIHPDTKRQYLNHYNLDIQHIKKSDLISFFNISQDSSGYTIKNKTLTTITKTETTDESRSATEYKTICGLISKKKTKEQIFKHMEAFDKWKNSPDSYKEYSYNKALNFIESKKHEPISDDNIRYQVYELLLDNNDETKAQSRLEAEELLTTFVKSKFNIKTLQQDEKLEMWGFKEGIYIPTGQSLIKEELRKILGRAFNQQLVNKVILKVSADTYISSKDFFQNQHPFILPVKNGLLNLENLELEPFDHNKIFFSKLPVQFDKDKDCPHIRTHLLSVLKDEEDIFLLQEALGNTLIKNYTFQKATMLVGSGRNGKGVTLDCFARLLGIENCSAVSLGQLEEDQFALSELHGKLANISGDISKTALEHTGKFKNCTGGDLLQAPRKFMTPIYFVNHSKFFFACNELPAIKDNSRGFWDRWLYFEFPYTFVSQKEYNLLTDEERKTKRVANPSIKYNMFTDDELSGFLNFAIQGMQRLKENNGFSQSKTHDDVKDRWTKQSDSFKAFCMERVEVDFGRYITKNDFKNQYFAYCKKHNLRTESERHIKEILTTDYGAMSAQKVVNGEYGIYVWSGVVLK